METERIALNQRERARLRYGWDTSTKSCVSALVFRVFIRVAPVPKNKTCSPDLSSQHGLRAGL
jgi:hypothetical protein